ncbi:hypothetical protein AUK40_01080 [Candidatus Wirthbacteria bacterium CG2_30_54_11]|uniref:DZANK-type domain-containing protein n=1 Tax=Candidatus Wirthbacteria bacterium CG2_30_54_11 TaxID=1817892 RepID=A0A1J5J5I4_9BACT|nr:MAG: hypothetical protein AUK40_01080 [Candidatus Wirthbacteria bacterium CG2_30_54_11]
MLDFGIFLESKPILYTLIFLGLSLAAMWILSIYWVYQDIFTRSKNAVLQIVAIVVAIVFPFAGLLMYVLLRPGQTMEERRLQLLDEKIMRRQIGDLALCPHCRKSVDDDFLFCPFCRKKIKDTCPGCEHIVTRQYEVCPYCGYDLQMAKTSKKPLPEKDLSPAADLESKTKQIKK